MKKLILAAILGTLTCGNAIADKWVVFGADYTVANLVNMSNIKRNGDSAKAWLAYINIDPKKPYDLDLHRINVNCFEESMQISVSYDYLKGKLKNTHNRPSDWFTPPPGSVGHAAIACVCEPRKTEDYGFYDVDDIKEKVPEIQGVLRKFKKEHEKDI